MGLFKKVPKFITGALEHKKTTPDTSSKRSTYGVDEKKLKYLDKIYAAKIKKAGLRREIQSSSGNRKVLVVPPYLLQEVGDDLAVLLEDGFFILLE